MTFDKGSLILIDYTARIKDTDDAFDTTIKADAEKYSIYNEDVVYQPKLVSIGDFAYSVLQGLDEALAKTSVGDKLTVEVSPDKAFGQRDPKKVRAIPIRKLGDDADKVTIGDTITLDNKTGTIRLIGSGRVHIDYNHKFAGKTILYDVNVIESLDSSDSRINGIVSSRFGGQDVKTNYNSDEHTLNIELPQDIFRAEDLQITKHFMQQNIFKFVPTLRKLSFVETYTNPSPASDVPEAIPNETTAPATTTSSETATTTAPEAIPNETTTPTTAPEAIPNEKSA